MDLKKIPKAFTLLELSVVLTIVGIITFGVIQGGNMINAARVNIARSLTNRSIVPEISGLVAWYESSLKSSFKESENYDGAQLTTWYDNNPASIARSQNTLTTSASTDITYEALGIGKIPSIKFNGTSSSRFTLSSFYQGSSAQATIFLVLRPLSSSMGKCLFDSYISSTHVAICINSNSVNLNAGISANTGTTTNPASFSTSKDYILSAYFNGSNSQAYVNNATTMAGNSAISSGSNLINGLFVGNNSDLSYPFNGYISEIIIYNRTLSDRERKDVMGYLAKKYRITVTGL